MMEVAIVGANGFIGSRLVENFHLAGRAEVRPVVRNLAGLARAARFRLNCRVGDALDHAAMEQAFAGCEIVIHAIAGSPQTIVESVAPVYRAANATGVRRLIYLSSASVHGQSPALGTIEASPLRDHQTIAYNNAKVRAERKLLDVRQSGKTEVVILRPGIVVGPRSFWITDFAGKLLSRQAAWLDHGRGICNSIYIDNLVYAIDLAMSAPNVDREAFLLGDEEMVTWADLYLPIAAALGIAQEQIWELTEATVAPISWQERLHRLRSAPPTQRMLAHLPDRLRQALYALFFAGAPTATSPTPTLQNVPSVLSEEMALLYQCAYKLPHLKAAASLHYVAPVSFEEGCRRTIAWLQFAGYPVVQMAREERIQSR